jgi:hypothetical protein
VHWLTACALGACGGAIVELIDVWGDLDEWRRARQEAWRSRSKLPRAVDSIDFQVHVLLLVTRVIIGLIAGAIFHAQVTGPVAAIAVGASAPALLQQFGRGRGVGRGSDQHDDGPEGVGADVPRAELPHAVITVVEEAGE